MSLVSYSFVKLFNVSLLNLSRELKFLFNPIFFYQWHPHYILAVLNNCDKILLIDCISWWICRADAVSVMYSWKLLLDLPASIISIVWNTKTLIYNLHTHSHIESPLHPSASGWFHTCDWTLFHTRPPDSAGISSKMVQIKFKMYVQPVMMDDIVMIPMSLQWSKH